MKNEQLKQITLPIEDFSEQTERHVFAHHNRIDHNVFWDIRCCRPWESQPSVGNVRLPVWGSAVRSDGNEKLQVDHNFVGKVEAYAVAFSLQQAARATKGRNAGRTAVCRANRAEHNVFFQCPNRIHLGRREENVCDHNLYDQRDDALSFHIAYPEPACRQNLAGWQEFFGLDLHSRQAHIEAEFDLRTGQLTWKDGQSK